MKIISLTQGYQAQVDDEDHEELSRWSWYAHVKKSRKNPVVYAVRKDNGVMISMAVVVAKKHGIWVEGCEIDHRDGDRLNNQSANLRPATETQNQGNQLPRVGTSQYKGVSWSSRDKRWRASIRYQRKKYYLGNYTSEEDAARAYDRKAVELFGDFARLNFPL